MQVKSHPSMFKIAMKKISNPKAESRRKVTKKAAKSVPSRLVEMQQKNGCKHPN
jgi:hypothetical protein